MDVDSEDDVPEKPIEVNVKIPIAMQPRTIRRPTPNKMIGPKRVTSIGKFTTQAVVKAQTSGSTEQQQQPKISKKEKMTVSEPIGNKNNLLFIFICIFQKRSKMTRLITSRPRNSTMRIRKRRSMKL